ncbi:MAG: PilC/PilY family type IV pilus protein [Halopseudomonas sp.]
MKQLTIKTLLGLYSALVANLAFSGTISQVPLHVSTTAASNVLINMSVETPMGGAAYNDQPGTLAGGAACSGRVTKGGGDVGTCYIPAEVYLGYFNPNKCYSYNTSSNRFEPKSAVLSTAHDCSGRFSGNFMNWASMTAIDMFVWTMTGGNRVVDTTTETVIQRMKKQDTDSWFPHKYLSSGTNVAPSTVTPWSDGEIYIDNTNWGIKFGTTRDGSEKATYDLNVQVCDSTVGVESNCQQYGSYYKPEGLVQKNADSMRFGVTSFSLKKEADGGVLRSNMKYVGPNEPDGSGGEQTNPLAEFGSDGLLINNPVASEASASGVSNSGVINYLNKFSDAGYKSRDPASELFYESIRYYKNLGRTPEYIDVLSNADLGDFPAITAWQDPIQYSCQKNFILGINDANPWHDKKLPGTHFTSKTFNGHTLTGYDIDGDGTIADDELDYGEPSNPDADINVTTLTNKVGDLEGLNGTNQRIGCTIDLCPEDGSGALNDSSAKHMGKLGQVMGTSPDPQKENSYYIAGLAYYANTEDVRSDLSGDQTITTFMIDTQEYKSNPLVGQMNMLWLAGKYGGFVDADGDGVPDAGEWDSKTSGEPDNYVLASRPDKLVNALSDNFSDIQDLSSSSTAVTASSTRLNTETQTYQASFSSADWSGELVAFPILSTGALGTKAWDASFLAADNRNIYSWDGSAGFSFDTANNSTVSAAALSVSVTPLSDDEIDYLRGDQSNEVQNNGLFRDRDTLLGDIVNSNPRFVGRDNFGYAKLDGAEGTKYGEFRELASYLTRKKALYVGANDGMLHGFDADTGIELFGYVPRAVYSNLASLSKQGYDHRFFVDGTPAVSDAYIDQDGQPSNDSAWSSVLVGTLGAGGKGVYALDVTTPSSFAATDVLWEVDPTTLSAASTLDFANLGVTMGEATIARMANDQWAAIFSNGYDSASKEAIVYVVDLRSGALIKEFNTGVSGNNGMATPVVIDSDGDLNADAIYAGDLKGNLWKIDVSDAQHSNWDFAFYEDNGTPADLTDDVIPKPLFVAQDSVAPGNTQPITAKPQVGPHSQGGVMVYFGTGKYFETQDNVVGGSPKVQSFYGIWDQGVAVEGDRDAADSKFKLVEQTIDFEATFGTEFDVRVTSDNSVNYIGNAPATGWYMDLKLTTATAKGERVVNVPLLRGGRVIFETLTPSTDPCDFGGSGWIMALDAFTGSSEELTPFDINRDGKYDDDDKITVNKNGVDVKVSLSGLSNQSMQGGASVLDMGKQDRLFFNDDDDDDKKTDDLGLLGPDDGGRQSWQQLQ